MTLTFRQRIHLTLIPLLLLVALLGAAGTVLIERAGISALAGVAIGSALGVVSIAILARHAARTILRPIQVVTQNALGISVGKVDLTAPRAAADELEQMAQAFNGMAQTLYEYRQAHTNRFVRAQQTCQATIDAMPDAILALDCQGRVELANPAARSLLGLTPGQPGHASGAIWHAPEALSRPLAEALRGQRNYVPEGNEGVLSIDSDEIECSVAPRIVTIRDARGGVLGAAVFLRDVTRLQSLDRLQQGVV